MPEDRVTSAHFDGRWSGAMKPCRALAGPRGPCNGPEEPSALWSSMATPGNRLPGTDVEVRALTDKPLALRYRSSRFDLDSHPENGSRVISPQPRGIPPLHPPRRLAPQVLAVRFPSSLQRS